MIWDELANARSYHALGERFARGFDFLHAHEFDRLGEGRHEVLGQDLIAIVQSYQTKPAEQGKWEAHRKYADIQYIVTGGERFGIAPISTMTVTETYDKVNDLVFFQGTGQRFTLSAGQFAVFLPHDVHMPSLQVDAPARVTKVVIKVRL
ncbi:MAG TPA: YhcH/YjgK/YiaL family protein [Tepidisphaeraceae bacterium]|jgi:YhcH/YjgK/YiaL family protein